MNRILRQSTQILAAIGVLAGAIPAQAIDRFSLTKLPHLGYGGQALGFATSDENVGTQTLEIVGQVGGAGGTQLAALWRPIGGSAFTLTILAGIGGPNSR